MVRSAGNGAVGRGERVCWPPRGRRGQRDLWRPPQVRPQFGLCSLWLERETLWELWGAVGPTSHQGKDKVKVRGEMKEGKKEL